MNKVSLISAALLALTSSLTFGSQGDGHAGGNGGDPVLLRTKLIRQYINTDLRNDAQQYFKSINLDEISNVFVRRALKSMKDRDVETDISDSSYVLNDSCSDVGGQVAGGAIPNDRGGDICISPRRLAELNSSKAEIVGLIIHEHAHHFGYADKDYSIYNAVYQTVLLGDPNWSEAGPQPFPEPSPNTPTNLPTRLRNEKISVGSATSAERHFKGYVQALGLAGRRVENVKVTSENGWHHVLGMTFSHRATRNTACTAETVVVHVSNIDNIVETTKERLNLLQINERKLVDAEINRTGATGAITDVLFYYCK